MSLEKLEQVVGCTGANRFLYVPLCQSSLNILSTKKATETYKLVDEEAKEILLLLRLVSK